MIDSNYSVFVGEAASYAEVTMETHHDFTGAIGKTPLVGIPNLTKGLPGRVLVKLEYLNPLGSLKDRIARAMVKEAEAAGRLRPGVRVLEASSGNTGIALAGICAARGYRLTVVMPETMSLERRTLLMLYGAEVILSPGDLGLPGAIAKVREILEEDPAAVYLNQGENPANPEAHVETAQEIWEQTQGLVDALVLGVGTGGAYRGMASFFRHRPRAVEIVAVEPDESAPLSGGVPGPHGIAGIGPGIIPPHMVGVPFPLPHVERVSTDEARATARRVIRAEGLPVGISSGASIAVALRLAAKEEYRDKWIVTLASSFTERYLSTPLAEEERTRAAGLSASPLKPATLENLKQYSNPYFYRAFERSRSHESPRGENEI